MNIIDVLCKINFIADLMFQIPLLPKASLTLGLAASSSMLAFLRAATLKALLYIRDADPTVPEFFNVMIVANFGSTIKSIKLVDLTAEENKQI